MQAEVYLSNISPVDVAGMPNMTFGKRMVEIGLMLRDAMFVNGVLFNSEAWHAISSNHIEELEVIDCQLLRHIVGVHAKAPI